MAAPRYKIIVVQHMRGIIEGETLPGLQMCKKILEFDCETWDDVFTWVDENEDDVNGRDSSIIITTPRYAPDFLGQQRE